MATEPLFELRRRTFDTPAFRGIEFIESEAKTILNHVKGNSLPFNWTINPYRGCSHACSYCQSGDTPILMADGRTRFLKDLLVGDAVLGTRRDGNYRRYVTTKVEAHWQTMKPAYRVALEDGTELIASGDHRFLTRRGWKYVIGTECGRERRPHLTLNSKLMGVGKLATPPRHDADYRTGYLCGIVRGEGNLARYEYSGQGRTQMVHRFRVALTDLECLCRTKSFLEQRGVDTHQFVFQEAVGQYRRIEAIRTASRRNVMAIEDVIRWPGRPSLSWWKGFLAGIFDGEGGFSGGILRISNTDAEIISHITSGLRRLGFFYVLEEKAGCNKPVKVVRLLGELSEKLRFFLTVDPAITRKRTFEGTAIKSSARLKVTSIEPLGIEMPMYDITTGTGDFIANGVISHNCFARTTHTYLDMNAGSDFDRKIVVKVNAPELLRKELRAKRWKGELIAMGTNTDPYQRAEGRYKLMPRIIQTLTEYRNPFSILTKGTLILRDLELLEEAAAVTEVTTAFSIGTLDEDVWRKSEPGTPHPRKRMEAVARLNEAGIPCGVLVAPILPGISDGRDQIKAVIDAALEAGATHVYPILLHLRPVVKDVYMEWLRETYPDLVPRYEEMYRGRSYASNAEKAAFAKEVDLVLAGRSPNAVRPRGRRRNPNARKQVERLETEQLKLI
ncbi:MAG: intein-containing Rv2578c family radical SAM protein [Actinomycetota bacterium]|nr:intein-containing Rv2578c family radical SAM protein [Actinomycetota bacterium]